MREYLKKSITAAAAVMMAATLLAGCGGDASGTDSSGESSKNGQTGSSSSSASASSASTGAHKLKILGPESSNTYIKFADRDKYGIWKAYEKTFQDAGVELDFEIVPTDQYQVVIQTRMASANDLPDFANITKLDITTSLNLASKGVIIPINSILEKGDGTAQKFYEERVPFVQGATTASDGNMYWITNAQTSSYEGKPGSTCMMIAIRQDWLEKLGLKAPTTADEFVTVMKAFREQDVNGSGGADEILAFDPSTFQNGIAQWFGLGTDITSVNLTSQKVVSPWYQEGAKEYFTYLNRLVTEGILDTSLIGAATSDMQDQKTAENKVGATFTYAMQRWLEPSVNADTEVYYQPIGPLPAVDGITPATAIEPASLVWNRWAFTKNCTDLEGAAKFLDIVYSDYTADLDLWGLEGETYQVVNGNKEYLPNIDNSHWEDCAKNGISKGDWLWGDSIFPRMAFKAMEAEIAQVGGGKAQYQKDVIFHDPRFPMGNDSYFALPTNEQLTRKSEIQTDLTTYSKELATKLILGQNSLNNWDTYMAELKELGLDEMLTIDSDLYARFLAAQK